MTMYRSLEPMVTAGEAEVSDSPGDPGELVWIELGKLVIDRRYQREIGSRGRKTILRILEDFSWAKFDPVLVAPAEIEGCYAILDGQHRATAALMHPAVDAVPCYLHELTVREQARSFRAVNAVVTAVTPLQLHHAGKMAGDPDAMFVDRVCEAAGVAIPPYPKPRNKIPADETLAVGTIDRLLRAHGERPVRQAMETIRRAYPAESGILNAQTIGALTQVFVTRNRLGVDQVVEHLKAVDLWAEMEDARSRSRLNGGSAATALVSGLLARLPDRSLAGEMAA